MHVHTFIQEQRELGREEQRQIEREKEASLHEAQQRSYISPRQRVSTNVDTYTQRHLSMYICIYLYM
jgi:hypothetical protein